MENSILKSNLSIGVAQNFQNNEAAAPVFGKRIGVLGNLFGCWHENLSRPFVQNNVGYRACLQCGARKRFDQNVLRSYGGFHYAPVIKEIKELK